MGLFPVYQTLFSQSKPEETTPLYRHSFGIQYNPFIDIDLFQGHGVKNIFAARYGYRLWHNIRIGPEFSGYRWNYLVDGQQAGKLSLNNYGVYSRYSLLKWNRFRPLAEISIYYSHFHMKTPPPYQYDITDDYISFYVAPGFSFLFCKNHLELDLFYKFSYKDFINERKSVISYRFSINF
jgi:hypothetical protein